MRASNRIIINTLAQYVRTVINLVLSLYSSRLVLLALGVDDYGIYSLVAGVVSMLSFLTNSLIGSTQRFLSVAQGKGDLASLKSIFSNSLFLHIILGLFITILLMGLTPFLFDGFLNIPSERESIAKTLYLLVVWMVYVSFLAAPYRALLVSRENIVYTSIIDVIDGVLKVVLVIFLPYISFDKLLAYGCIMMFITFFNFFAFMLYSHLKYEECIFPCLRLVNLSYLKELSGYTGWVVYSSASVALKMQGLAIVLNRVMGTAINAAYGIGFQIAGMLSFVSSSFNNAIAPQLMAACGSDNRERMWILASIESKFSFLLLSMLGIPTMFELPTLLKLWLVEVPEHAVLFACMFLITQIVDMLSTGLALVNRAIGNLAKYTLVTYTPKLLVLPLGWLALKWGYDLIVVCFVMIFLETICMLLRVYLFKNEYDFSAFGFCKNVIIKTQYPVIITCVICYCFCSLVSISYRILLTYMISISVFLLTTYLFSLSVSEKNMFKYLVNRVLKK